MGILAPFQNFSVTKGGGGHSEASAPTQPDAVHNLIGMTALVMWPKLPSSVKSDDKVTFLKEHLMAFFNQIL